MHIPVLYEDNHLLLVTKPPNIPVQQDASKDIDMVTYLKQDIKERYQKPGNVYLGLVHRLDRPVGGVMVFAKTSKAASRLSNTIRKNEMEKTYLAVVRGVPKKSGTLKDFLWKDRDKNKTEVVSANKKGAKEAILAYEVIGTVDDLSLVKINLITGRSHQIRVQFASRGYPLYGDQKYGSDVNKSGQQIALWAYKLTFPHPVRDEMVKTYSSPPKEHPWSNWKVDESG